MRGQKVGFLFFFSMKCLFEFTYLTEDLRSFIGLNPLFLHFGYIKIETHIFFFKNYGYFFLTHYLSKK